MTAQEINDIVAPWLPFVASALSFILGYGLFATQRSEQRRQMLVQRLDKYLQTSYDIAQAKRNIVFDGPDDMTGGLNDFQKRSAFDAQLLKPEVAARELNKLINGDDVLIGLCKHLEIKCSRLEEYSEDTDTYELLDNIKKYLTEISKQVYK